MATIGGRFSCSERFCWWEEWKHSLADFELLLARGRERNERSGYGDVLFSGSLELHSFSSFFRLDSSQLSKRHTLLTRKKKKPANMRKERKRENEGNKWFTFLFIFSDVARRCSDRHHLLLVNETFIPKSVLTRSSTERSSSCTQHLYIPIRVAIRIFPSLWQRKIPNWHRMPKRMQPRPTSAGPVLTPTDHALYKTISSSGWTSTPPHPMKTLNIH